METFKANFSLLAQRIDEVIAESKLTGKELHLLAWVGAQFNNKILSHSEFVISEQSLWLINITQLAARALGIVDYSKIVRPLYTAYRDWVDVEVMCLELTK